MTTVTKYGYLVTKYGYSRGEDMQKRVEQIDLDTGEVLEGCMVYIPYRPKITERWFMAFQDTFIEIAKDQDMTGETMKVLMYLFGRLHFENFIQQSQADIADGLGMHKQHVSRAMRLLTSKQIVLEGPKDSRSKCYRLNPHYGWKGKVRHLDAYRQEEQRQDRLRIVKND